MNTTLMSSPARPRLALVLGSGGVRSAAALGITDVLAREGVSPDLVVGPQQRARMRSQLLVGHHEQPFARRLVAGMRPLQ